MSPAELPPAELAVWCAAFGSSFGQAPQAGPSATQIAADRADSAVLAFRDLLNFRYAPRKLEPLASFFPDFNLGTFSNKLGGDRG